MKWPAILLIIVLLVLVVFVFFNSPTTKFEDIRRVCCTECLAAFSQSPVGVGPQAARCGEFTSALDIGEECSAYFKTNPMTVQQCQELA